MFFLDVLKSPEILIGDFLLPWGMVISVMGFLAAWVLLVIAEHNVWTRHIWHLPLFFVSLAVLMGCVFGLLFAP